MALPSLLKARKDPACKTKAGAPSHVSAYRKVVDDALFRAPQYVWSQVSHCGPRERIAGSRGDGAVYGRSSLRAQTPGSLARQSEAPSPGTRAWRSRDLRLHADL